MGTPPQKIENVVLDTGSYVPWIKLKGFCTAESCPGSIPASYDAKASTTFKYNPAGYSKSKYGSGSIGGVYS